MSKLRIEFDIKFDEYLTERGIEKGLVPVTVDSVLSSFSSYASDMPITKAMLGRALTKRFLKKQLNGNSTQCYYLNKEL